MTKISVTKEFSLVLYFKVHGKKTCDRVLFQSNCKLQDTNFSKAETRHRLFPLNFPKPLRRAILLWDACQRLLLYLTEKYISIIHFSASIDTKLNIIISSRPGVLFKIDVIKSNAKFTKKHLCQSLYFNLDFNKVAGRGTATSLKKRLDTHVFLYICCEIFKSTCFTENLQATTDALFKQQKQPPETCSLIKKETLGQAFASEFCEVFNDTHREKLCFNEFRAKMTGWLFQTFLICLHNQLIYQIDSKNEWLLLPAGFTAKFGLVFVLTLENAFSQRFHFQANRKSIGSSKKRYQGFSKQPSV